MKDRVVPAQRLNVASAALFEDCLAPSVALDARDLGLQSVDQRLELADRELAEILAELIGLGLLDRLRSSRSMSSSYPMRPRS